MRVKAVAYCRCILERIKYLLHVWVNNRLQKRIIRKDHQIAEVDSKTDLNRRNLIHWRHGLYHTSNRLQNFTFLRVLQVSEYIYINPKKFHKTNRYSI